MLKKFLLPVLIIIIFKSLTLKWKKIMFFINQINKYDIIINDFQYH